MKKSITVVSGKGGTGKSFVTCNTAVVLAGAGFKTLIVDADTMMASVEIMYGISPQKTLQDLVAGEASPEEVIYEGPNGVLVVPAGARLRRKIRPSELDAAIASVVEVVFPDYLLIDAAAGLDSEVVAAAMMTEAHMVVCNPEVTSLADAYKVKSALAGKSRYLGAVLNRVRKIELGKHRIAPLIGPIIATVPDDERVRDSINSGVPFVMKYPESAVTRQIFKVASAIAGADLYPEKEKKDIFGFLKKKR
uniref:CobQ/CobB/MinD/ParA nucleotide binding domain-containing protein n=1 Tax=Archaeoglobus fulgidus TaxID=2234 RepID=A0A7C2SDN2_ARCFL